MSSFVFMETSFKQKNKKRELAVYETELKFKTEEFMVQVKIREGGVNGRYVNVVCIYVCDFLTSFIGLKCSITFCNTTCLLLKISKDPRLLKQFIFYLYLKLNIITNKELHTFYYLVAKFRYF